MLQKSKGSQWVQGPLNMVHSKPGWVVGMARTSSYPPMWEKVVSIGIDRVHPQDAAMVLCRYGLEKDTRVNATTKPSGVLAGAATQAHDDAGLGRPSMDALLS